MTNFASAGMSSGPNWIHGTEDNPILDLAKETNTVTHNWDGRQCIYNQQGSMLPEKEAAEAAENIWSIIGDGMEYAKEHGDSIPSSKSLLNLSKRHLMQTRTTTSLTCHYPFMTLGWPPELT